MTKDDGNMRGFDTGATRDTAEGKLDFEGFLSPFVLRQYAKFMDMHRLQSDGQLRDSDNWQKGIPMKVYMKSLYRHFEEMWYTYRMQENYPGLNMPREKAIEYVGAVCGVLFNTMGYLHEWLKLNPEVRFNEDEPIEEMRVRQAKVESDKARQDILGPLEAKYKSLRYSYAPDEDPYPRQEECSSPFDSDGELREDYKETNEFCTCGELIEYCMCDEAEQRIYQHGSMKQRLCICGKLLDMCCCDEDDELLERQYGFSMPHSFPAPDAAQDGGCATCRFCNLHEDDHPCDCCCADGGPTNYSPLDR